jgi:7-cyano-7-deazaguanine synthase
MKAVAIISGGMDSAVAAKIAQNSGYELIGLHFNYSQRTQNKELQCFRAICDSFGVKNRYEIDLPFFADIGASALIDKSIDIPVDGVTEGIPVTYVPFRNGIFFSIAAAIAEKENASALVLGAVEEDSSGYPDCTQDFQNKMEAAIRAGTKAGYLNIVTPVINMSKSQIVLTAIELGVDLNQTWSCYKNEDIACGVCDSCRLRLKGIMDARKITNKALSYAW